MSFSFSLHTPKALPPLSPSCCKKFHLFITSRRKTILNTKIDKFEQPALGVTGVKNEQDFVTVVIELGIVAAWYFLVMPPIIMNWRRIRWHRRKLLEMYLQFMCVFVFLPGLLLRAPFLNFRKFAWDPSMKNP